MEIYQAGCWVRTRGHRYVQLQCGSMLTGSTAPGALIPIGTEACAASYPMARMQLAMMETIQAQRTPLAAVHRGVGARQVKVKLYGARKLIWRKHRLVLLFIESSLRRSGE